MSVFRPTARTESPDGRRWEIYAYRFRLPRRRRFLRRLADVPAATIRAFRSDEWTIQALSYAPYPLEETWTTTREFRDQVLAQVEGGIARGESPRPRNARYLSR